MKNNKIIKWFYSVPKENLYYYVICGYSCYIRKYGITYGYIAGVIKAAACNRKELSVNGRKYIC